METLNTDFISRISFVDEILKLLLELRRKVYNAAGAVFELEQFRPKQT
jgi:hypothetical protein